MRAASITSLIIEPDVKAPKHINRAPESFRVASFAIPRALFGRVTLFWSVVLWLWSVCAIAQTPISNLVFTVGTTTRDASNNDWSYVLIGSSSPYVLNGKEFVVFGKPGFPTNVGTFTVRGSMGRAKDLGTVNSRLNQSLVLGQNLVTLSNALNGLLRKIPGITNQTLAQKILTAFQVAASNPITAQVLDLLGNGNPGLRLCDGQAFTELLPTTTTYELRERNALTGLPGDVVGRVTIVPNAPVILPAPGPAFQVVTNDPADHLLIRLRWGTPPELRRLSLLSFGYNLWRIQRAAAEAGDFHHVPPTVAQLYSNTNFVRANVSSAIMARRNMATGAATGAAEDPADRITYFFADNGRATTGTNFFDGQEFYYFVTARDLLGRDGIPSFGRLARACRRNPPDPPVDVRVDNTVLPGSTNQPRLLVVWNQNTNATDTVNQYWIYRWANATFAFTNEATPLSNRVGVVNHVAGTNLNFFVDNSIGALTNANPSNVWYTVRAVTLGACDPLLSAQAGPAWGVLRERNGPDATTGEVLGSCGTPVVMFQGFATNAITNGTLEVHLRLSCVRRDPGIAWAMFTVTNVDTVQILGPLYFPPDSDRLSIELGQAFKTATFTTQFGVSCTVGTDYGQVSQSAKCVMTTPYSFNEEFEVVFLAGQLLATALNSSDPLLSVLNNSNFVCDLAINVSPDSSAMVAMQFGVAPGTTLLVQAQTNGLWTDIAVVKPDANNVYWISYPACLIGPVPPFRGCTVNLPSDSGCAQHITGAANGGPASPLRVRFRLTPRTREYRVYRRADDGPLTLLAQGPAVYDPGNPNKLIEAKDEAMPSSPARLCYFVQVLDEHGNGSPLSFIGCKSVKPPKPARPVLAEPQSAGTTANPQVVLNWFCPTSGISRFQFKISRVDSPAPSAPSGISSGLLKPYSTYNRRVSYLGLVKNSLGPITFSDAQLTELIGPAFGPGPQFTLPADVIANATYDICVAPVDEQGTVLESATSEVWRFKWTPPVQLANVPWPARPLPPVREFEPHDPSEFFSPRATAQAFVTYYDAITDVYRPIGIRIGTLSTDFSFIADTNNHVSYQCVNCSVNVDPHVGLFRSRATDAERANRTLLPLVVYRQQVANTNFPKVSGDIVQATPLIERVPWKAATNPFGDGGSIVTVTIPDRLFTMVWDQQTYYNILYVLDQQPAVLGARYRYFVVRFNEQREPYDILPVGEVELPLYPYNGP